MGQKVIGHRLPAEAAFGDVAVGMSQDESVFILMKHCRDMKQQESCLRLTTLLLLLSCTTLFVFVIGADSRLWGNSGLTGQMSATEQQPAHLKQEGSLCAAPADNPKNASDRFHIYLEFNATKKIDGQFVDWRAPFGEKYNKERRAIVIPKSDVYFVYVTLSLRQTADNNKLTIQLYNWNEGYNQTRPLEKAWRGAAHSDGVPVTVFFGRLFDLMKGDHVSVKIDEGYNMVMQAHFGAYLA